MIHRHSLPLLGFFVVLGASQTIMEPAYYGYLVAFAAVLLSMLPAAGNGLARRRVVPKPSDGLLILWLLVTVLVTMAATPAPRDVLRDMGAVLAFVMGCFVIPAWLGPVRTEPLKAMQRLLRTLSDVGLAVAAVTLLGAAMAYQAGATAYFWRGEYVPMVHSWLPYCLAANVALIELQLDQRLRFVRRALVCIVGTLASLSRTDLLLEIVFAVALLALHGRLVFSSPRWRRLAVVVLAAALALAPGFMTLDVVQQRIEAGADEDDASLGWRLIENVALIDQMVDGGIVPQLLGFGWGARMPLPAGVEDFDGNDSIPLLHNSLLTIALKFGLCGLLVFSVYLWRKFGHWRLALADPAQRAYAGAGAWIIVFCLGKAITLQGLTEWSHLVFFGIGCMLVTPTRARQVGRWTDAEKRLAAHAAMAHHQS